MYKNKYNSHKLKNQNQGDKDASCALINVEFKESDLKCQRSKHGNGGQCGVESTWLVHTENEPGVKIISTVQSIGILYAVLNAFLEASSTAIAKYSSTPPSMLVLIRASSQALVMMYIMIMNSDVNINDIRKAKKFIFLRGLFGLGMLPMIFSVRFIPLSEANVIMLTSPIFTLIFASFFLKEAFGLFELILLLLTVAGVISIANPVHIIASVSEDIDISDHMIGCCLAISKALLTSMAGIVIRKLKHIHYSVISFTPCVPVMCISIGLVFLPDQVYQPLTYQEMFLCLGLAATGIMKHIAFTLALQKAEAGVVSLTVCTSIIFSVIYQYLLFDEVIVLATWCGIILISTAVLLSLLKTQLLKLYIKSIQQLKIWLQNASLYLAAQSSLPEF